MTSIDRVGQQLGNYRLTRLIGQGGFADVYLGEHVYLNTQAAIKVLSTQLTKDSTEQFLAEARSLASLLHPHIIRTLDFGVEDNGRTPFLVMDYAPGGTLRSRYPKGERVPLPTIVDYVKQVADALQYAHDRHIVHRDIKPENMLLGRNNELLLSDFGIAVMAQSSHYESAKEMAGTIAYMAPEQIQSHPRPASDQYALAVIVYEWLTGDRPFHGSFSEIAIKHTMVPPPPLRAQVPAIPPDVERVVLTGLEKDPQKRFAKVSAFAEALQQASQDAHHSQSAFALAPVNPAPPTYPYATRPPTYPGPSQSYGTMGMGGQILEQPASQNSSSAPISAYISADNYKAYPSDVPKSNPQERRRVSRRVVIGGIAGAVGLLAAGGGATYLLLSQNHTTTNQNHGGTGSGNTPQATATSQGQKGTTGQGKLVYTYQDDGSSVFGSAWSPDSKRVAIANLAGKIAAWDATSGNNAIEYPGPTNSVSGISWSHNGTYIAAGGLEAKVRVWKASGGNPIYGFSGHSDVVNSTSWSPDSKRIASASDDKTVKVWDATTGDHLLTYKGHTDKVASVAWSPKNTLIASSGVDHTAQVWNAATVDQVYVFKDHTDEVQAVAWAPDGHRLATASDDLTAKIWDINTKSSVITCTGHTAKVVAVSWSPDGKYIATASWDSTVRVWDASNGKTLVIYQGHNSATQLLDVAWSPDGAYIASSGALLDDTVQVWQPFPTG